MAHYMIEKDRGAARRVVEGLTRKVLAAAAERRQGGGAAPGARAPFALGQPRRETGVLVERESRAVPGERGGAEVQHGTAPVTPIGYRTATLALPRVIKALAEDDPRRRAALAVSDSVERIGSVGGASLDTGTKSGVSDGGATTRVKHAARLRRIEALANGWAIDASGRVLNGPARLALRVTRRRTNARNITAMALLRAVCVDGIDLSNVLTAHGWSPHRKHTTLLRAELLAMLDNIAEGIGYGRAEPKTA